MMKSIINTVVEVEPGCDNRNDKTENIVDEATAGLPYTFAFIIAL